MIRLRHFVLLGASLVALAWAQTSRASASDIPVAPGLSQPDAMKPQSFCKSQIIMSSSDAIGPLKVQTLVSWYAANLRGSKHFHSSDGGRSQDTFFTADGAGEVTITGTPGNDEVFAVSFGRINPALKPGEMALFNTGRQSCGR
jgi:hypothetical protein